MNAVGQAEMHACRSVRRWLSLFVLLNLVLESNSTTGFLGRVHAIAKRIDDAMQSRADDIRNRTNQTVENAPDVISKLWDYVKKNTNDPPLNRVISDITKIAVVQDDLLAAIHSVGGCHTEEGKGHCKNAKLLLDSLSVRETPHRP